MPLLNQINEIAAFCKGKNPENECIFGIDGDGELHASEQFGTGNSFQGMVEQIQFRGGTSRQEIEQRLLMREAYSE